VQWRQVDHVLDPSKHDVVDANTALEALATVHDAMTDGLDLTDCADNGPGLGGCQPRDDVLDRRANVSEGRRIA
jgi:hypothetical protein